MYNQAMSFGQVPFKRQAAVVPFRVQDGGRIEILLIRRKERPWGVPKGGVEPGRNLRDTALNEAAEEAGLHGELLEESLGEFMYPKQKEELLVSVYAMRVAQVDEHFMEEAFRERRWVTIEEAMDMVGRKELQPLIAKLGRIVGGGQS